VADPPKFSVEGRKSSKLAWIALGALASLALVVGFLFTSGMLRTHSVRVPASAPDAGLALRVERNAGDILLTWNRDADAIKRATRAVLLISDGPQQDHVEMDLTQLRTGSIVYSPVTSDVVFRMDITGAPDRPPTSETVRVLRTRPSPMPETAGTAAHPEPAAAAPGPNTESAEPAPPEEKVALAQPLKPFRQDAASLARRLRPARPADLPDTPALGAAPVPAVAAVNLAGLASSQIPAPPPTARPVETVAPSIGGQIQPAALLRRTSPEFPKLARESGAGGLVEVIATVGVDGRVKDAKVMRGHPLLRQPAIDAVKQWVYRPTLLNGKPVESETHVTLDFKNERR
jgi:protein TonB